MFMTPAAKSPIRIMRVLTCLPRCVQGFDFASAMAMSGKNVEKWVSVVTEHRENIRDTRRLQVSWKRRPLGATTEIPIVPSELWES